MKDRPPRPSPFLAPNDKTTLSNSVQVIRKHHPKEGLS
jgi:hypothetical protein